MPRRYRFTVVGSLAAVAVLLCIAPPVTPQENMADSALPLELALYAGSQSCIECHSKFYQLWSTSRHGLAMQPYTPDFSRANLTPQTKDLVIGKYRYRADIGPKAGWVVETDPKGKKKPYPILHALDGKNVCYSLTPLERGRLQTLPVACDVRTRQWFDTAASGVRHFGSGPPATAEYLASLTARPDQWSSRYNLGNYYLNRGEVRQALASYDTALKIEPRAAMVMVNAAMAYAQTGETAQAEKSLLQALKIAPDNAAAHEPRSRPAAQQSKRVVPSDKE